MNKPLAQLPDPTHINNLKTHQSTSRLPVWISIIVLIGALLTITGAIISKVDPTLLANGSPMTDTARVYADYMFARNLALALMLLFLLALRSGRMLAGLMVLVALVQIIDVIDDLTRGAFFLVPGLLIFAIVFLIGAWQLFGQAPWHINTWRELQR